MNDLVENYLKAIRPLLPSGQQDDIVAELSDEIQSRIEEKEAGLGRKLTAAEIEAILRAIGSPVQVAARYGANRYLIGPAVFPVYWLVLRAILLVVLLAVGAGGVIRTAVSLARGEPGSVAGGLVQTFGDLFSSAFFLIGFTTVVAAAIERLRPDLLEGDWLMDQLSKAPQALSEASGRRAAKVAAKAAKARRSPTQTRIEGAFGFAFNAAFFVWLAGFIAAPDAWPPYLSPERWLETTGLAFTPIWREQLFYLMLAGMAARMALHIVMLAWPTSQRRFAATKLLSDLASFAFAVAALQAEALFASAPGMGGWPKVGQVLDALNGSLRLAFAFVAVITALNAAYQLWRIFGPRRKTAPA